MRTSVAYFSFLLLQSFLVVPALCKASYHVYSEVQPKRCIVSTGNEKPGEIVKTAPYDNGCPLGTVVHTDAPVTRKVSKSPVSGAVNLYIGINGSPSNGTKLVWVQTPYTWEFDPATFADYHVVNVPGKHVFWFVDANSPDTIELGEDPNRSGTLFWSFDKVY